MSERAVEAEDELVLEYALDAPPEKVWRAVSIPAFVDKWLPNADRTGAEPVTTAPGTEIHYRMREPEAPFLESTVTFQITPDAGGGTILRIVHGLDDRRLMPQPANGNALLMRAA